MPSFALHPKFAGYSLQFNPFDPSIFTVGAAENFGIAGTGRIYILALQPNLQIQYRGCHVTEEGVYDVAWNESHPSVAVCVCGDGSVQTWDLLSDTPRRLSMANENIDKEMYSIHWNQVAKSTYVTGCWDKSIKLWDPTRTGSVCTMSEHNKEVYEVRWSPVLAEVFASVSGDGSLKVWDTRRPTSLLTKTEPSILLSCDWNKYDDNLIATGATNNIIYLWDLRILRQPRAVLQGHQSAVKRVRFSYHNQSILASGSYDFSLMVWNTENQSRPVTHRYIQHTEFVCGLDWHLQSPQHLACCSWDGTVYLLQLGVEPDHTHRSQPPLPDIPIPPSLVKKQRRPLPLK